MGVFPLQFPFSSVLHTRWGFFISFWVLIMIFRNLMRLDIMMISSYDADRANALCMQVYVCR